MKKIFALTLLLLLTSLPLTLHAQTGMTDSQIMEFIIKENEKGTNRSQIMIKLMERGVSVERVRKIRRNYEKQKKGNVPGAIDISGYDKKKQNRLRKGNSKKDETSNDEDPAFRRRRSTAKDDMIDETQLTERQRRLYNEMKQEEMEEELDFALPDSLEMYDDIMGYDAESRLTKKKKGKQVFGRNIFNNKKLTFESDLNIATPGDYRLGAGDEVYIDVWGASNKTFQGTVSPDGNVDVEGFGPISVGGLTVTQANKRVRATLGQRYQKSQVKLTVGQTKTITVNVMGEVERPGTYTLSAFSTVFHALYMAGGTNDIGTLRNIKIYRSGREISTVDIYDYILNGQMHGNVRLQSGDVIIVGPYECLVNITGKVRRPMYYEMKRNESLGTLIQYAGGFTGEAYQGLITLIRKSSGQHFVYSIDEFERGSFQLQDADSVNVDSTLNRYGNLVEVKGAVYRPGKYQMDGQISTVRGLLEAVGGPTEDAFINRALLHRRKEDRTLETMAIDVRSLMEHRVPDVPLRNEDVLFVPSTRDMQAEQTLTIEGEVNFPGIYEYAENTTLEDFILQAGGLKDAASLVKVDVSRRLRNRRAVTAEDRIAQSFSFELKEGFVISGQEDFRLEPFDEVYVRRSPGYVEQQHVRVEGEIAFEGTYALTRKASRLSDLVTAAGGLTTEAYAKGARLERKLTPEEKIRQQMMLRIIAAGDSTNLAKVELGDYRSIGIHLDEALKNPGNDQFDIVLRDEDRLVIPQYNNTVSINGEVMFPNTVAYKEGEKLSYYINQAGGYSQQAKKSHVFAVSMSGTVTKVKHANDIQPGSEIVVPAKSKRRGLSFGEILSLSSMGISMSAVIASLFKR